MKESKMPILSVIHSMPGVAPDWIISNLVVLPSDCETSQIAVIACQETKGTAARWLQILDLYTEGLKKLNTSAAVPKKAESEIVKGTSSEFGLWQNCRKDAATYLVLAVLATPTTLKRFLSLLFTKKALALATQRL